MFKRFAVPALLAIFALAVGGQAMNTSSTEEQKNFGIEPDSSALKVEIPNLVTNPEKYLAKSLVTAGVVKEECPGGHWFILQAEKDTTREIFVTLSKAEFVVPQAVGAWAQVYGHLVVNDGKPTIEALGVEFGPRNSKPQLQSGTSCSEHSCCR